MNSAVERSREIDSLANDIVNLIGSASVLLQQCEIKLLQLKHDVPLERVLARENLASEIASLMASSLTLYKDTIAKSRGVRTALHALTSQAVEVGHQQPEAMSVLAMCQQTEQSLDVFETMIAQLQQVMATDLESFRNACLPAAVTPEATFLFDRLMQRVMSDTRDRAS